MDARRRNIAFNAQALMKDGGLDLLLTDIKHKLALDIISTPYNAKDQREELYMLSKAADVFAMKLQEYVNEIEQETH